MAPTAAGGLSGHVIVCGLHGIGLRVVEQLLLVDTPVVVIDDQADDRSIQLLREWEVPQIIGNSRRRETLERAGLHSAAAMICTQSDELAVLETSLIARAARPGLRVIARLANEAVGSAIEDVTGPGTVLNAAALAAPAFVQAALKLRTQEFQIQGETFRSLRVLAQAPGTLREHFGDLAPVAITGEEGDVEICPGRDAQVCPGDTVTVVGTPAQLKLAGLSAGPDTAPPASGAAKRGLHLRHRGRSGSVRAFWHTLAGAGWDLKATILAVFAVTIVASIVINIGYINDPGPHMDFVDAVYTTVQTLVTVGYGDFPFGDQPTYLRVFDIGLMLIGAMLIAILFAQITDLLVSRRIAEQFGADQVQRMHGHVIVVGFGSFGLAVAAAILDQGRQVVVLERDPANRYLRAARELGIPVLIADATHPESLRRVHLGAARAVVVLTSDDFANIETALVVRERLGRRAESTPVVVRLFGRELSRTVETSFGFRNVRSTAALAAPWFVAAALGLDVYAAFTIERLVLLAGRVTVTPEGGLAGVAMQDLDVRIRVIAIDRESGQSEAHGLEHPPRRGSAFAAGDSAYIIGPHDELLRLLLRNQPARTGI